MTTIDRRTFILQAAAAGTTTLVAAQATAQAARLDEKDPQATALGYRHDTTKVDRAKFPKHANDQKCSNCQLFQAKAGDAWGGCPLFGTKQVAANGWCSAWVKKG